MYNLLHDRGPKKPMEMQVSMRHRGKVIFGSYLGWEGNDENQIGSVTGRSIIQQGVYSIDHSGVKKEIFLLGVSCLLYLCMLEGVDDFSHF